MRSAGGCEDAYPAHTITVVSPFPPGGVGDVITRPLDAALEIVLKQPVVLENKAGAAGAVGAQYVASAKPDGYTLLTHIVSISGFASVDRLFGRTPKFTNASFIPIARIVADPIVLIVNSDLPYKTVKELVGRRQGQSEQVDTRSSGALRRLASPTALFAKAAGDLKMRHLPTNGGGPAVTAVLGGNVNFFMSPASIALAHIRAGRCGRSRCRAPSARNVTGRADVQGARLRPWILLLGRHFTPPARRSQ